MTKLVSMLIICWIPQSDASLKEAWRIEKSVSLEHCLAMNRVMSVGGRAAAITVRCAPTALTSEKG